MGNGRILRNVGIFMLALVLVGLSALIYPLKAQPPATPAELVPLEERVNAYLAAARVEAGATDLAIQLAVNPEDDQLRLAAGFLQFATAVEHLGQSWYEYGLRSEGEFSQISPFLRLPVPQNPQPQSLSNQRSRQILNQFVDEILTAEQTLAEIGSETVKLGIAFGQAYLDFDGDGQPSPEEALWQIYAQLNRQNQITADQAADFLIQVDAGDVQWLRGYCHLMAAMLDFYLAHDDAKLFDHTAHLFFQSPVQPYAFLTERTAEGFSDGPFLDMFAMLHLINLPVIDSQRTAAALNHLEQVIALSRQTWDLYSRETDDDREWIPNPNQTGVIPGVQVTQDMIDQWLAFLDQAEAILMGEVLLPFWRGQQPLGINFRRIFTEPQTLDAVLWTQGTAAAPYLETGTITDPDFWWRLMDAFNGRFLFFALWFN